MLKDLIEYSKSTREKMKGTLREIKNNQHKTHTEGKEARIQIKDLEHTEQINIKTERTEETRIQKMRRV